MKNMEYEGKRIAKLSLLSLLGIVAAFVCLILLLDVLVVVPAGYVGVEYNAWGGIDMENIRLPGWSFKLPLVQRIYMVKTARDTVNLYPGGDDNAVTAPTKEGLVVTSDMTVLFKTKASEAPRIIQELTSDFKKSTIVPRIRSVAREVTGGMLVTEIYGPGREKLQKEVYNKLSPILEKDGFILEEVLIREVKMPPQIATAIEDKQAMEQAALKKEYELTLTKKEAERRKAEGEGIAAQKIAIAEGDAASKVALAKGEAEAKIIVADAEAKALKVVADAMRENPRLYDFKRLQVTEELYSNPNTKFIALPSDQMIYQLPNTLE